MSAARLFVLLLAGVVILGLLARRSGLPETIVLVIGGLAAGLTGVVPLLRLDPDVVLLVFLPAILFPSSARFAREDVRANARAMLTLALGLVLATIVVVALAAHLLIGVPWAVAFVIGAILGPTDPVAATAVLRRGGAPDQLATILEGESLVNDAVGLTAFRIAVGAVGGSFGAASAAGDFVLVAAGGTLIGVLAGQAVAWALHRLDDLELESAIAALGAYGSYLLAEELGLSGILAVVAAGFLVGRRMSEVTSPETRLGAGSFWGLTRFLSESMLFVLVGFVLAQQLRTTEESVLTGAGQAVVLAAAALAVRLGWMLVVPRVVAQLQRRGPEPVVAVPELLVLSLGGMRGAISVAVALAIPMQAGGAPFPQREEVLLAALGAVLLLLVLPALVLPHVVRRAGLHRPEEAEARARQARLRLAEAAIARARRLNADGRISDALMARAQEAYHARTAPLVDREDEGTVAGERALDYHALMQELLAAERDALRDLERSGEIHGAVARALERDLDRAAG